MRRGSGAVWSYPMSDSIETIAYHPSRADDGTVEAPIPLLD